MESKVVYTLDKGMIDEFLKAEKEWNKVLLIDHEGKIITMQKLKAVTPDEIKYLSKIRLHIGFSWDAWKVEIK